MAVRGTFQSLKLNLAVLFIATWVTIIGGVEPVRAEPPKTIKGLIESKKTIDDILRSLPDPLLNNYTLMQKSASLQPATPLYPRAILFGHTGELILTFHGNPRERAHNTIEIAEFDSKQRRVSFRELLELPKGLQLNSRKKVSDFLSENMLEDGDIDILNDRFLLTKPNPNKCMACHALRPEDFPFKTPHTQRLARYIWSAYDHWADEKIGSIAYGVSDDALFTQDTYVRDRLTSGKSFKAENTSDLLTAIINSLPDLEQLFPKVENTSEAFYKDKSRRLRNEREPLPGFLERFLPNFTEFQNYLEFRQLAERHPRYKYLGYNGLEFIADPYYGGGMNAESSEPDFLARKRILYRYTPNLNLSMLLAANFSDQMAAVLQKDPGFLKLLPIVKARICLAMDYQTDRLSLSEQQKTQFSKTYLEQFPTAELPYDSQIFDQIHGYIVAKFGTYFSFALFPPNNKRRGQFNWGGNYYRPVHLDRVDVSTLDDLVIGRAFTEFYAQRTGVKLPSSTEFQEGYTGRAQYDMSVPLFAYLRKSGFDTDSKHLMNVVCGFKTN